MIYLITQIPVVWYLSMLVSWPVALSHYDLGPYSHRVYKLMMEFLWKFLLLQSQFQSSNQLINLHMSWQLSCHDICKIMIRLDHYFPSNCNTIFSNEIWIVSSWILCEMGSGPLTHLPLVPHQWIGLALVQIMAWRLISAKPLSKPMLGYCQLDT